MYTYEIESIFLNHLVYCFSTATMVAATRLDVTLYVHCLSCWHPASTRNGQYSDTAGQAIYYSNNEFIRRGSLR